MMRFQVLIVLLCLTFPSLVSAAILPEALTEGMEKVDGEYICSFAPSQSAAVKRLSALASGGALGAEMILLTNKLKYVKHSSGLPILQASGRYLPNTISSAGQIIVPVALVVAGTAVVVELACVPINHPELLVSLNDNANKYLSDANLLLENASVRVKEVSSSKLYGLQEVFKEYKTITKDKFYELIGETWYQRAVRKTKETFRAD